jgi:hypothetical protein
MLGDRLRPFAYGTDNAEAYLIAHHLLLGDTIMLTPLLAKCHARGPEAEIVMTCAVRSWVWGRSRVAQVCAAAPRGTLWPRRTVGSIWR